MDLLRHRVLYWQFSWVRVLASRSDRYRVLVSILSIPGSVSGSRGSRTSNGDNGDNGENDEIFKLSKIGGMQTS